MRSNCCNASVYPDMGDVDAGYGVCMSCKEPCDIIQDETISIPDSGNIRTFEGGAIRDENKNKPRYDLIPPESLLRVAKHFATGAKKYGESNWEKGLPAETCIESAFRHFEAVRLGKMDEDHVAATIWNLLVYMEIKRRNDV